MIDADRIDRFRRASRHSLSRRSIYADPLNEEERGVVTEAPAFINTMTRLAFDMHPPRIPAVYSSTTLEKETSSHDSGETVASASANSHMQHSR